MSERETWEIIRAKDAEIAALKQQVEQLCGDVQAVSKDYTNARQEIAALTKALEELRVAVELSVSVKRSRLRNAIAEAERVLAKGHLSSEVKK